MTTIKNVFKYPVEIRNKFSVMMPDGAEILTVQMQHNKPQMWALVDQSKPEKERIFRISGTGHPMVYDMGSMYEYINSFQMRGGDLIFHLFECKA